jgi:hypothetical protein
MADDVIKSFLVRIGYKHDEVALRKIGEGISTATKAVFAFGAAIASTATAVAWGVTRIASNLETLYFSSIRTGSSASSLEAFELAARRMGAQAGSGLAAVESLAAFFRNNPPGMAANALRTWFPTADINENDPVKTMVSLGKAMQTMDYYQAKMRGNAAGLTDEQIWFLRRPELGSMFDQMQKNLGPNFEKAVEDAHRFENSLNLLGIRLEGFGAQVIDVLQNKFGWSLDRLSAWLDKNGEKLTVSLVNGLEKFLGYIDKLAPKLEWLLDQLIKLDEETDGWSTVLIGLSAVMPGLVTGVISLGTALAGLAIGGAAKGIGMLGGILNPAARLLAAGGIGYALGTWWDSQFHDSEKWAEIATNIHDWFTKQRQQGLFQQRDVKPKEDWAMQQFVNMGWSPAQAAGLVANAFAESSMDPNASNAGHRGLFQWDADRWKTFELFARTTGSDTSDPLAQLRFADYELRHGKEQTAGRLLLAAQNASQAGYIGSHYYERPGSDAADMARSSKAVQLSQQTVIHVDGSAEPQVVAKRVADAQDQRNLRLASAITREFASNIQ